jgi:flagellar hook-associated protein 2
VTIDSSNNTLSGIRDAINSAGIGVTAAIINDGSNSPFRLALTNNQTGQTQSMRMAVAGATGLANLLNYDPANNSGQALTELNKAQNALIKVDGITITKTSNTIDDAITGVTLSLQKTNTGNPTSLNIARNTNSLTTNLQNLVKGYNDLAGSITSLTAYDSATHIGAALYGENSLRSIKNQIRSTLASALPNTTGFSMLSQVGISFQKDGTLALDSSKLQTAIDSSYDKISSLFTATGKSSDSQINYTSATPATKAGSYAVAISQLATQGSVNGSTVAGLSISAGSNDSLDVSLDGVTSTLTLTAGTYANVAELVTEIQTKINGNSSFKNAGSSVLVSSNSDGSIKLISNSFGAKSSISLAGNAASTILGGNGVAQTGVNLIGSINGKTLASSGQYLIGATGDDSDGLTIKILGGSTGNRGVVTYTQGFAFKLNQLIDSYSAADGLITTRTDGISKSINRVNDNITKTQDRLKLLQAHYETIFNSLDTTMSKISSTSNYLTAQLASMNKSNNN